MGPLAQGHLGRLRTLGFNPRTFPLGAKPTPLHLHHPGPDLLKHLFRNTLFSLIGRLPHLSPEPSGLEQHQEHRSSRDYPGDSISHTLRCLCSTQCTLIAGSLTFSHSYFIHPDRMWNQSDILPRFLPRFVIHTHRMFPPLLMEKAASGARHFQYLRCTESVFA